jgi:hypothetical protein
MALLGEAPVFYLTHEVSRWRELSEDERTNVREGCAKEVMNRQKTLDDTKSFAAGTLAVLAFLSAEVIFAFTSSPKGVALILAFILAVVHGISLIILMRAIIPPPHTLFTSFIHPFEWAKGESGQRWTTSPDEMFISKDVDKLLGLNALAQFTKRCVVVAGLFAAFGQVAFTAFIFVRYG